MNNNQIDLNKEFDNLKYICKDFIKNNYCKNKNCSKIHDNNLCKFYYANKCNKNDKCNFNHFVDQQLLQNFLTNNNSNNNNSNNNNSNNNNNPRKNNNPKRNKEKYNNYKNTETFEPNYNPPDIRVLLDIGNIKTVLNIQTQDVILAPNLFCESSDLTIYNNLINEMNNCGIEKEKLFKKWHGGCHDIADDHLHWNKDKNKVPTFYMIVEKIASFFNMDIKANRFNLYEDDTTFKHFHHDSAAVKPEKAKTQNFTVGVSFGCSRDIAFEDALEPIGHRRIINFPLVNGSTYCFSRDININWRHGILPIHPNNQSKDSLGRISIIVWGYVNQNEVK